jgi:hypothetical protein
MQVTQAERTQYTQAMKDGNGTAHAFDNRARVYVVSKLDKPFAKLGMVWRYQVTMRRDYDVDHSIFCVSLASALDMAREYMPEDMTSAPYWHAGAVTSQATGASVAGQQ